VDARRRARARRWSVTEEGVTVAAGELRSRRASMGTILPIRS